MDGGAMPTDEALAARYRRIRSIGRGAMGEVWLAEDVLLHRQVAIKQLIRQDDESVARVVREARVAARLSHPNIVAVHDLVVVDGQPFVVMEYVPGPSLADEIHRLGRLEPARVARIVAQIADALTLAHQAGIAHRDIKPGNILLPVADGAGAKLADFGIARAASDASLTGTGLMIGTPAYLAPEVARGSRPGPPSDVWALGATMYAAVEGRAPFVRGGDENALTVLTRAAVEPVPPARFAGPLRPSLDRMLSRDPGARPTAAQVRQELDRPLAVTPAEATAPLRETTTELRAPAPTAVLAPVRRRRRTRVLAGGAIVAVLVVVGIVAAVWPRGPHRTSGTVSHSQSASVPPTTGTSRSAAPQDPMNAASMTRFVQHYYSLIPNDLTTAWTLLGPGLQAQGRTAYAGWWSRFDRVQVTVTGADAAQHTVTIRLSAHNASTGQVASDSEVITLIRTPDGKGLLINASAVQ